METCSYRLLQGDEIRLLRPVPECDLSYELVYRSLDSPPPYAALSYTWGPEDPQVAITIDGSAFHVRLDLHEALLVLFKLMQDSDLLLWIDAICVNQNDLEERSAQVLRMKKIYESATVVYAWLGDSDALSRLAIPNMTLLSDVVDENHQNGTMNQVDWTAFVTLGTDSEEKHGDEENSDAWAAISMFFRRAWWSRTWIIQEATSAVETIFFVGTDNVPRNVIANTLGVSSLLHMRHGYEHLGEIDPGWSTRLDHLRMKRESGTWLPLLDLLDSFRHSYCGDPRDKIYAALPLASDIAENDIVPDYSKTVQEVYTDLVRSQINKAALGHALDFLGHVVYISRPEGQDAIASSDRLPSWLPDWRERILHSTFGKRLKIYPDNEETSGVSEDARNSDGMPSHHELLYQAGTAFQPRVEIRGRQLVVHGCALSHVVQLSPPSTSVLPLETSMEESWLALATPSHDYPSGCSAKEAIARTMVADVRLFNGSFVNRGFRADEKNEDGEEKNELQEHIRLTSMKVATFKRRLAWTESGYVGLVPECAKIGDTVCVFFGGQVLYVLRTLEEGASDGFFYEFIGECYFHGLMDGEICRDFQKLAFSEEAFCIL